VNSQTGNVNFPQSSRGKFVLNLPTGEESDTNLGDNQRFDSFGAPDFNPLI